MNRHSLIFRRAAFAAALTFSLSACEKPDEAVAREATTNLIMAKNDEIAALKADVAKLEAELAARRPVSIPTKPSGSTNVAAKRPIDMCYKDYCPCDPPQGGPDALLCDRLQEGLPVETEMMINSRALREARRQIAESDY
jgi:hypothetical protein